MAMAKNYWYRAAGIFSWTLLVSCLAILLLLGFEFMGSQQGAPAVSEASPVEPGPPEPELVATMGPLETGTIYNGRDLDVLPVANAQTCSERCRVDSSCGAMTYVTSTGTCWLKKEGSTAAADPNMVSAVKVGNEATASTDETANAVSEAGNQTVENAVSNEGDETYFPSESNVASNEGDEPYLPGENAFPTEPLSGPDLPTYALIVSVAAFLVSGIGTASSVILGWRNERRQAAESRLKIEQLELQLAEARKQAGE